MYPHKSGWQKRKERVAREARQNKGQQTLFQVGLLGPNTLQAEDSANLSVTKALGEASEKPDSSVSFFCEKVDSKERRVAIIADETNKEVSLGNANSNSDVGNTKSLNFGTKESKTPFSAGSKTGKELHENRSESINAKSVIGLDIGCITDEVPSQAIIEKYITIGHIPLPKQFPNDSDNQTFPEIIFKFRGANGEMHRRDFLVWSEMKQALYCLPCRLFWHSTSVSSSMSALASPGGWTAGTKWRKVSVRVQEHEKSKSHKECYIAWKELERRLLSGKGVDSLLEASYQTEAVKWCNLLKRILDVVLFLGERGLAFSGSSHRIGDPNNGNFLGLIELLSRWDPLLQEHVNKVKEYQGKGERLQVHYLSPESQNEFISECSTLVKQHILLERKASKYFAVIVDATPDSSHVEQATILLRYLNLKDDRYEVQERFLMFVDCSSKRGEDIAQLIMDTLEAHAIPLSDCRAQGYDNAANMAGKYKGAHAKIQEQNSLAIFSPCGCHTLNLCGNDAAESLPEAITYFGTVQTIYNLFSSSPKRWELLNARIGCSLHGMSETRWSDRLQCIKPFAFHLNGIQLALQDLLELNLTAKTRNEINGVLAYLSSFICVLMSAVWYKILAAIDICNKVIQARDATLDVEVSNIETLLEDMVKLRSNWKRIWNEAKEVALNLKMDIKFSHGRGHVSRKRTRMHDGTSTPEANMAEMNDTDDSQEEAYFRKTVFYVFIDNVVAGLTVRFNAVKRLADSFDFLWKYPTMCESELEKKAKRLAHQYPTDLDDEDLAEEMQHLPVVHKANFGKPQLKPLELLNLLKEYKLCELFPNVCISLRILLTIPATVASAERSFSKLKIIKNYLRSTMSQTRLVDLARLSIEPSIARQIDFDSVIRNFAHKKARKAQIKVT